MTLQERFKLFIEKAKTIHGDKYDYSEVNYIGSTTKVTIKCNNCGEKFDQTPMSHIAIKPSGCPHCRYKRRISPKPYTTLTTEEFIVKANDVHNNKYTYDKVNYTNSRTKVIITCKMHGDFVQVPNAHISKGAGCPICEKDRRVVQGISRRLNLSTFIDRANKLYDNKYDYSKSIYTGSSRPIIIICPVHGEFTVARAERHLVGQKCPNCNENGSLGEERVTKILDKLGMTYDREKTFDDCVSPTTGRKLRFDFFISDLNVLIEFDGEQHFKPCRLFNEKYPLERYQLYDQVKTNYAQLNGYTLIRLTEKTINNLEKMLN